MRTQEELVTRMEQKTKKIFSFQPEVFISYLSFENAKLFIKKEEFTEEEYNKWKRELTRESILEEMKEYMEFAWGKAIDHRGISAGRSVDKMQAWLWLLEDNETLAFAEDDANYPNYGAPILKKICEVYNFPIPDDEDARLMAEGKTCASCERGDFSGCV